MITDFLGKIFERNSIPQTFEWIKKGGFYILDIEDKTKIEMRYDRLNKRKFLPINEEERKEMWHASFSGPKNPFEFDTSLNFSTHSTGDGFLPSYSCFLSEGRYKYGIGMSPGLGDIRSWETDYPQLEDFKKRMNWYFSEVSYTLANLFGSSNLPETHKDAVKDLIN